MHKLINFNHNYIHDQKTIQILLVYKAANFQREGLRNYKLTLHGLRVQPTSLATHIHHLGVSEVLNDCR